MNTVTSANPVVVKRAAESRGKTRFDWLDSWHSFSFGEYYDPQQMGFRSLRVINDDIVAPGQGFGTHPHRDAEIFTYVISGELEHKDSMGNGAIVRAGDLQYMSAGSGVRHSEFNPSSTTPVHLLQIWLLPKERGGEPRYAEKSLGSKAAPNALTLLFSGDGQDGAVAIRQDARIYFGKVAAGRSVTASVEAERHVWLHVIEGNVTVAGESLTPGDAVAISNAESVVATATKDAEFLFFDLA